MSDSSCGVFWPECGCRALACPVWRGVKRPGAAALPLPPLPPCLSVLREGVNRDASVPGPCEPEDLIDGIIFAANYLGSTQLLSERNPSKNIRMMQAQEAVSRVKVGRAQEGPRLGAGGGHGGHSLVEATWPPRSST